MTFAGPSTSSLTVSGQAAMLSSSLASPPFYHGKSGETGA